MGNYSVPEVIRKLKPKGTMVKKIKSGYYVYSYTSRQMLVEDADGTKRRKTKTTMGNCIGSITEKDGFILMMPGRYIQQLSYFLLKALPI